MPGDEDGNNEQRQPIVDEGGESSDEGVQNDADQGYSNSSFSLQTN